MGVFWNCIVEPPVNTTSHWYMNVTVTPFGFVSSILTANGEEPLIITDVELKGEESVFKRMQL